MNDFDILTCSSRIRSLRKQLGLSHKTIAEKIGVSEQLLKNYEVAALNNGVTTGSKSDKTKAVAGMRIETLVKLAQLFNVSTDYLLGLTNQPTPSTTNRAICEYTGLSEDGVKWLHENSSDKNSFLFELERASESKHCTMNLEAKVLNDLLFDSLPENKSPRHRSILSLLAFFFDYENRTNEIEKVNTYGQIKKETSFERKDGVLKFPNLGVNEIILNPTIIENAVLMELQQALISLKLELKSRKDGK